MIKKVLLSLVVTALTAIPVASAHDWYSVQGKLIWEASDNTYYVITPKNKDNEYLMYILQRGVYSQRNSAGAPADLLRVTNVRELHKAYIYKHERGQYRGTWETYTYNEYSGAPGRAIKFWKNVNGSENEEITFRAEGNTYLGVLKTPSSSTQAQIFVDDNLAETVNLNASSPTLSTIYVSVPDGNHTVKVRVN